MKKLYIVGILLLLIIAACAKEQQTTNVQSSGKETQTTTPQQTKSTAATGYKVSILGKEGFNPQQLTINAGSTVTWTNNDQIALTLTIFKDGSFFKNSDVIDAGKQFQLTFDQKGSYEYWSVAYDVKGYITVK